MMMRAAAAAPDGFDLAFAEALRHELEDTGVTVTALQPGPTDTNFFERADMEDTKLAQADGMQAKQARPGSGRGA